MRFDPVERAERASVVKTDGLTTNQQQRIIGKAQRIADVPGYGFRIEANIHDLAPASAQENVISVNAPISSSSAG